MSLKINEDPVSTPASEWAEQTTSALGSSANNVSSQPAKSANAFSTGAGSTATTPGVDVPGGFPRSSGPNEPLTLPDVSQHVENAKEYINSVDLSQHVETVRQYLPAKEDVQATVAGVAQTMGQYLPDGVLDRAQELIGRGGHSTTPHDIDSDLRETSADREGSNILQEPVKADATVFDPTSIASSAQPSPEVDSNGEPFGHSVHSTVADTQHAARVPLPPPTSSFAQPTVDVSNDEETGSPVVTVHPEAETKPEASLPSSGVGAGRSSAVGGTQTQSDFKGINDAVRDSDMGPPDTLPAISNAQGFDTGTTTSSAPTGLEKPVSAPISGALSPPPALAPPPPPKDTTTTATPSTTARQDAETRSTSSDAGIPSMGSEDKLGGHKPWDDERSEEGGADTNGLEKEKKGSGASKLLGKVKEKLKSGHGQKA